jgi:nicotinamidase-related amidase
LNDALLLVDVINDFRHEDGEKLLASFRERHAALLAAIEQSRAAGIPSSTRTTTGASGRETRLVSSPGP